MICRHNYLQPFLQTKKMKIIDNKKDYYDYLSGIYGIDDQIVYDRRESVILSSEKAFLMGMDYYFSKTVLPLDKRIINKRWRGSRNSIAKRRQYQPEKKSGFKVWTEGDIYHFILEVGFTHYRFEVERWIDEKKANCVHVEYTLLDTIKEIKKRYSDAPICIIPCRTYFLLHEYKELWQETSNQLIQRIKNPILIGTIIPKFIAPEEIWQALYDYLSSLKDKPIIDTRTDVQKLESAGFDKKTSFRNVK